MGTPNASGPMFSGQLRDEQLRLALQHPEFVGELNRYEQNQNRMLGQGHAVNGALGCLAKRRPARHIQEAGRRVRVADCDPASWAEPTALRCQLACGSGRRRSDLCRAHRVQRLRVDVAMRFQRRRIAAVCLISREGEGRRKLEAAPLSPDPVRCRTCARFRQYR